MIRMEFHCHTDASPDSLVRVNDLVLHCHKIGLDRVLITDHNSIAGALRAKEIDPQLIIVGQEIVTTKGELLAAFVKEEIPKGLTPQKAIELLRGQGAFISVSHPFDKFRKPWALHDLMAIVKAVDAIEVFNSRCILPGFNRLAGDFASANGLQGTVGSDAHTLWEYGRSSMRMPDFSTAEEFKKSLSTAHFETRRSGLYAQMGSRYAAFIKRGN